jgi:hypothetical protein
MTEIVVVARILVYRVTMGVSNAAEIALLDERLADATTIVAPSCEFLGSHRMLTQLARTGDLTPSEATRLSMLTCESGVELRPLWPMGHSPARGAQMSSIRCVVHCHCREQQGTTVDTKPSARDGRRCLRNRGLLTQVS